MRFVIEFVAVGKTLEELEEATLEEWRKVSGDPDASLPREVEFNVSPHTSAGSGEILWWQADVTIRVRSDQ